MNTELTNRSFWESYWESYQYEKIPKKVPFAYLMSKLKNKKSFIEIGGFPGTYATYFYKSGCKDVWLLDFFIDKKIVNQVEEKNNVPLNTIKCIEADFFKYNTCAKYEIVFSIGFIEHFENTSDAISRHVNLLADNGSMLLLIPNFRGLNGFIQKIADKRNYEAHNLQSMIPSYLKSILHQLKLKNIAVKYSKKPIVWLEPGVGNRGGRLLIKGLSYMLKLFPVRCRLLSPFIIIYAEKSDI